jgi:hypothetical protein
VVVANQNTNEIRNHYLTLQTETADNVTTNITIIIKLKHQLITTQNHLAGVLTITENFTYTIIALFSH